jgi:hypothetical protein
MTVLYDCRNCSGHHCIAIMSIDSSNEEAQYPGPDDLQCLRRVLNVRPIWRYMGDRE